MKRNETEATEASPTEASTISTRIAQLVRQLSQGNQSAFARAVGISNQGLGEMVGGRKNAPSFRALQKILTAFPQLQAEWVLFGTGPMLHGTGPQIRAAAVPDKGYRGYAQNREWLLRGPGPQISVEWRLCADPCPVLESRWWVRHSEEYAVPMAGELLSGLLGEGSGQPVLRTGSVLRLSGQRNYVAEACPVVEPRREDLRVDEPRLLAAGWQRMKPGHRQLTPPSWPEVYSKGGGPT